MTIRLTWNDNSAGETGHKIYRDSATMDVNALPAPLATIAPELELYDDTTAVNGNTYFYIVSSFKAGIEKFSQEIEVLAGTPVTILTGIRIVTDAINGGTHANLLEWVQKDSSGTIISDVASGGTTFENSSQSGATQADKAFDDIITGDLYAGSASGQHIGWYVGKLLGTPLAGTLGEYTIYSRSHTSAPQTTPTDWHIQTSDNTTNGTDGTWSTVHTVTGQVPWLSSENRTFSIISNPSNQWRVRVINTNGGFATMQELYFYTDVAGTIRENSGTAFASSIINASWAADGAFDDIINATAPGGWQANSAINEHIGKTFTSSVNILNFGVMAEFSGNLNKAPKDFLLEYFFNGTWIVAASVVNQTGWANGELRKFVV